MPESCGLKKQVLPQKIAKAWGSLPQESVRKLGHAPEKHKKAGAFCPRKV
jgi:hypothetical protein